MSDIVTTDEAAELAGVDPSTIRQWVARGDLQPLRRGVKPLRFDYAQVARVQRDKRPKSWLQRHAQAVATWERLGGSGSICHDSRAEEVRPEPEGPGAFGFSEGLS